LHINQKLNYSIAIDDSICVPLDCLITSESWEPVFQRTAQADRQDLKALRTPTAAAPSWPRKGRGRLIGSSNPPSPSRKPRRWPWCHRPFLSHRISHRAGGRPFGKVCGAALERHV